MKRLIAASVQSFANCFNPVAGILLNETKKIAQGSDRQFSFNPVAGILLNETLLLSSLTPIKS